MPKIAPARTLGQPERLQGLERVAIGDHMLDVLAKAGEPDSRHVNFEKGFGDPNYKFVFRYGFRELAPPDGPGARPGVSVFFDIDTERVVTVISGVSDQVTSKFSKETR